MSYVSPEDVRKAKELDLLTYLRNYEPNELVKLANGNYCTREHDSLKISNGKWHWFSRGIGGKTALDYLIKVQNYSFPEAVETILGRTASRPPVYHFQKPAEKQKFVMPELSSDCSHVGNYLLGRGIDRQIIDYCFLHGLLYETKKYRNAAFVGYDMAGKAQYAALRGTIGDFKGEVPGSDKHYAFSIRGGADGQTVHLFEAAIDAMSYATLLKMTGREWQKDTLLSLGGVYKSRDAPTTPMALEQYLKDNPATRNILLHLDNDEVGRGAAQSIANLMGVKYRVVDAPTPSGKDVNAYLMQRIEQNRRKEEQERC